MTSVDDRFDQLVGRLQPTLTIVTTAVDGARAGCVVGFHSQCGIDPPRYAVWISKANYTYRIGVFAERFAVHFLRRDHLDHLELARRFATVSGDDVDKFADGEWSAGPGGVPLLDPCPDRFVGRRLALLDAGPDHVCVVLEPVEVHGGGEVATGNEGEEPDWLTVGALEGMTPGHAPDERHPPT